MQRAPVGGHALRGVIGELVRLANDEVVEGEARIERRADGVAIGGKSRLHRVLGGLGRRLDRLRALAFGTNARIHDHLDAAHAFLDFILTPSVQAKETPYTFYASGVSAAIPCMDPSFGGDKSIFPSAEVTAKLEVHKDLGDAIKLRDELWTKFKSA